MVFLRCGNEFVFYYVIVSCLSTGEIKTDAGAKSAAKAASFVKTATKIAGHWLIQVRISLRVVRILCIE